jgi:myo-inositol-1(or 4)-monophosphatase
LPDAEPIDRAAERERLTAAVREAGARALAMFGGPLKSWTKGHSSPVCEADIASNELLRVRLADATPGFGWLSEESQDDPARLTARRVWVVDPIDGTRAYIAGRSDWSISAALVEDGRPVIAVLFAPVSDELFIAVAGDGASRNGVPISATTGPGLDGARVAGPKRAAEGLTATNRHIVIVPKIHSLALRLARVAQGELDAAFASANSHDWDLAAADLLVHEAGGAMTTFAGRRLTYNRAEPAHGALIAAGPERHATLLDLLRDRRAEFA